ncbi:MAG: dienelactone hydrolase family protein [Proteobacteria bacterium]|nr:dienelactone hydrolase family protein [Pseudomonadota bacterium]
MKRVLATLAVLGLGSGAAQAEMVARNIDYTVDGAKMQSVLVYDDAVKTPRPGLVMAPDWYGMNANQIALAKQIAGSDYVILVADVYGTAVRPKNPDEAGKASGNLYKHRDELRARIKAALAQLVAQQGKAPLDGKHWGAIGFCFGGAVALDLARSGANIAGTATFHGSLSTDDPALAKNIKGMVLAMNGADDSFTPESAIQGFEKEMRDAGVDWQFVNYGGAVHCFAIPSADGSMHGCKYDAKVAHRAFALMHSFFGEAFGGK